eukprot:6201481-Alexandrium_andersonii.AAC.1
MKVHQVDGGGGSTPEAYGTERRVLTMPGRLVEHHLSEQDEFEARQMEHGAKELLELGPIP